MKAMSRLIVVFLFCFACSTVSAQCIQGEGEPANCPPQPVLINPTNNVVRIKILDPLQPPSTGALQNPPNGRYKAFWILGDGNYRYYLHGTTPAEDSASRDLTYRYQRGGNYTVMSLLSEKKSNTDPPPNPDRRIQVADPLSGDSVDTFSRRLSSGKPVDIFNSEWNRPKYPTAFVVSAPRNNPVITGIYFFYNSKKNASGVGYTPTNFHDALLSVQLPNYMSAQAITSGLVSDLTGFPLWFFNKVSAEFQNYIFVPIAGFVRGNMPQQFSEIRFFPILRSAWDPAWIAPPDTVLPVGHYLAVTVGNISLRSLTEGSGPAKYITSDSAGVVINEMSGYFGDTGDGGSFELIKSSSEFPGQYIHGIGSRDVEMMLSIDPNGLQVLEICPDGRDKYKVKCRLEVCNKGYMPESNFKFVLTDHSKTFSNIQFSDDKIQLEGSTTAQSHQWNYLWGEDVLDEIPLPDATGKNHSISPESCAEVEFTTTTNWNGVQSLVSGKALEVCVQFAYANPECHYNFPLNPVEVTRLDGYNCGSSCNMSLCDFRCILYTLLILLLLLLILQVWVIWILLRKYYKKANI